MVELRFIHRLSGFRVSMRYHNGVLTFLKSPAVNNRVIEGFLSGEVERGSHGHICVSERLLTWWGGGIEDRCQSKAGGREATSAPAASR